MNFLAHLHLSYPHKPEMVGNFIGDYVKGRQYNAYPQEISQGIQLHRKIDSFTDRHQLQRDCKALFRKEYALYAGIITDMLFDHLLAKDWSSYSDMRLMAFSDFSYNALYSFYDDLPERVQGFLPKMKASDRLCSYATLNGIIESISLMSRYTSLPEHSLAARSIIESNYSFLEAKFHQFYQELMLYVANERR